MTALDNVWYVEKLVLANYHDCSIKIPLRRPRAMQVSAAPQPCPSAARSPGGDRHPHSLKSLPQPALEVSHPLDLFLDISVSISFPHCYTSAKRQG